MYDKIISTTFWPLQPIFSLPDEKQSQCVIYNLNNLTTGPELHELHGLPGAGVTWCLVEEIS